VVETERANVATKESNAVAAAIGAGCVEGFVDVGRLLDDADNDNDGGDEVELECRRRRG
jgi:hypothetical protein